MPDRTTLTGGAALARVLRASGVRELFGVPAGRLTPFLKAVAEDGGPRHAAVARALGCHGERIERPDEVAPALDRVLASGLPAVIDARVAFVPHPGMRRFAAAGTP